MIEIVEQEDTIQKKIRIDNKDRKHKEFLDRICCYPGHEGDPHKTWIDPDTGVAIWRKVKDKYGKWDGKSYYCEKDYQKAKKAIRKGTLKKDHNIIKGGRVERAIAKGFEYRDCNREKDNYNYPFDLYDPINKKRIHVRSSNKKIYTKEEWKDKNTGKSWGPYHYSGWFCLLENLNWYFEELIFVCMAQNYKDIEQIYKIPKERLDSLGFYIYDENIKSHKKVECQYKDYLIDNEILEKIRRIYQDL